MKFTVRTRSYMVFVLTVPDSKCSTKKKKITILVNDFKKLVKPRTIFYFFNKQGKNENILLSQVWDAE